MGPDCLVILPIAVRRVHQLHHGGYCSWRTSKHCLKESLPALDRTSRAGPLQNQQPSRHFLEEGLSANGQATLQPQRQRPVQRACDVSRKERLEDAVVADGKGMDVAEEQGVIPT